MKPLPVILLAALQAGPALAQPLLTADEAVRLGLERNFDLAIARDQTGAAENNRRAGLGPFLPTASAFASQGGELDGSSPRTSVGAQAGLLIFDGFQSYNAYRRLKAQERSTALQERLVLEGTVESILGAYYGIASQKRRLDAIRELLAVSGERARLAQARMEVGAGSRLDHLQALADLNADSSAFLSQQVALAEAKVRLNLLLGRSPADTFDVRDSIPLEAPLPIADWRASLADNNAALLQARTQVTAASAGVSEARGARWPDLNAGLRYSTAPVALNPDLGPVDAADGVSYSLNLSLPLFDGFRTGRDIGNAKLGLRQEETRLKQREHAVLAEFEQASLRHASGSRRVALEERNMEVARQQAEAAREKFRVGASSPIEFRDAQTRLLDAHSRLATARQETKQSELALKRVAGILVKEAK